MAKLTDFEELISRIVHPLIKDYMREAMVCYNTGAYRGCIVMSYIALFDDLIDKVGAIKDVNADAKAIFKEVEKRRKSQDIYENYLLEQLASKSLISELDSSTVKLIQQRRNKSAHPSGHHPSAEEARFVFFEVIDKFLSKESLGTKHVVDEIVNRLGNAKFFTSTSISDTEDIVKHEISGLHEEAIPYLVIKITDLFKTSKSTLRKNSGYFLDGLASIDYETVNKQLAERLLNKYMDDEDMHDKCLSVVSSNPNLTVLLDEPSRKRFLSILDERLESMEEGKSSTKLMDPSIIIKRSLDKCGSGFVFENFEDQVKALVVKLPFRERVITDLVANSESCFEAYFEELKSRAGSYTFNTANDFIDRFYDVEDKVVDLLSGKNCLELLVEIVDAAKHGAWRSGEVVESKFSVLPKLRSKVIDYLEASEEDEALEIINKYLVDIPSTNKFRERYLNEASQPGSA